MQNITFNICVIITQDGKKTIADIESVKQKNPGSWSFDDILIELSKKPYITDVICCLERYQL